MTDHSVDTPWPHFVWSKRACTHGGASGDGCGKVGVQTVKAGAIGAGTSSLNPGDDGEPLTVGDRLVGLVFKGGADMSRRPDPHGAWFRKHSNVNSSGESGVTGRLSGLRGLLPTCSGSNTMRKPLQHRSFRDIRGRFMHNQNYP